MRIEPVDVYDDDAVRGQQRTFAEAESYGRRYPTPWQLPEMVAELRRTDVAARHELFVAVDGGRVVGAGDLEIPLLDNTFVVRAGVAVPPSERRRGVGALLADHVLRRTRERGRRSITAQVNRPLDVDGDHPYQRFAARHGFTRRLVELHQTLELPVAEHRLDALAERVAPHHRAYRLVTWGNRCPPEHVGPFCELLSAMGEHIPLGELEEEPERWDEARLRETEQRRIAQGRTSHSSVAVAPDGSLAGYTQLAVPAHDPGQAYQWDTLVLPPHRGHRLGLGLKVANLRRMQAAGTDRRVMHTWNAAVNRPMLTVNVALGFRPVEATEAWQRNLGAAASRLRGRQRQDASDARQQCDDERPHVRADDEPGQRTSGRVGALGPPERVSRAPPHRRDERGETEPHQQGEERPRHPRVLSGLGLDGIPDDRVDGPPGGQLLRPVGGLRQHRAGLHQGDGSVFVHMQLAQLLDQGACVLPRDIAQHQVSVGTAGRVGDRDDVAAGRVAHQPVDHRLRGRAAPPGVRAARRDLASLTSHAARRTPRVAGANLPASPPGV